MKRPKRQLVLKRNIIGTEDTGKSKKYQNSGREHERITHKKKREKDKGVIAKAINKWKHGKMNYILELFKGKEKTWKLQANLQDFKRSQPSIEKSGVTLESVEEIKREIV